MIHLLVLAAAVLHLQDPAGDAVGDGTLVPPTAPVYADAADFDLQGVTLTDDKNLTVRVAMGALTNPGGLPNGFSNPVIEVYLDTGDGGARALLPGSGMGLAPKHGWNVALRVTGDEAYAVQAQPDGTPGSWPRLPVKVEVQGTSLVLQTSLPRPARAELYAVVGVYDPFRQDAWRPLSATVSPWAFSSASQRVPVVDVLASGMADQRRAIDGGVLLPYRTSTHGVGWLLLIVLGLVTAAAGAVLRRRVRPPADAEVAPAGTVPTVPEDGASVPEGPGYERFLDEAEEARLWPDADTSVDRATARHDDADGNDADDARPGPDAPLSEDGGSDAPEPEDDGSGAPEPEDGGSDAPEAEDGGSDAPVPEDDERHGTDDMPPRRS